jgi:hypothetical protein
MVVQTIYEVCLFKTYVVINDGCGRINIVSIKIIKSSEKFCS